MDDIQIDEKGFGDFSQKVILITGGSSGIGEAIADLFLDRGAVVINGDITPPPQKTLDSPDYHYVETDVSSWSSQLALFRAALNINGRIDIAIGNAGVSEADHPLEMKDVEKAGDDPIEPQWLAVKVNMIGALITVKMAMHYMRKQSDGGQVILTGSRASYDNPAMPTYTATKHAILGLVRVLKRYVPQWNMTINMIAPGITDTGLTSHNMQRFNELGMYVQTSREVALVALYLASNPQLNGCAISAAQGKYRDLEAATERLSGELYGPDEWKPKNSDELDAVMAVLEPRF